jgi:hypothetical protein
MGYSIDFFAIKFIRYSHHCKFTFVTFSPVDDGRVVVNIQIILLLINRALVNVKRKDA